MAREHNFLLGSGEKLAYNVKIKTGGGRKKSPYNFKTARKRISERLKSIDKEIGKLPEDACPRGEAVAVLTLHPRYLAKSDFPSELLTAVGLRAIGSRSRKIKPEKWGIDKHAEVAVTEDLFVAGAKTAFKRWADSVGQWKENAPGADDLTHIEDLTFFDSKSKLKTLPDTKEALLEVVLHNSGSDEVILKFLKYVESHKGKALVERRRNVQGLTFVPVRIPTKNAEDIAKFSFVRIARGMPGIRPMLPSMLRGATGFPVTLPAAGPIDVNSRAAIFDGGIPEAARAPLQPWVNLIEPSGIGTADPHGEAHGLGVTSAFLFGHLVQGQPALTPLCAVDHVRVYDSVDALNKDTEYFDVLDRIIAHLDRNLGLYTLVNISLGPALAVDDDDVTLWTASLDKRFAHGRCVVTVAAGNEGHLAAEYGLNRIQPPADGVNVMAIGAADRLSSDWQRAVYSSVGPGRCPGLVKPDGLSFGGSDEERFAVLNGQLLGDLVKGTSFASPFALRSAAAVRAQLGGRLNPLAIRALLIHRAENARKQYMFDVGWGRFESNPLQLITCDDDEALVVFQGELPVGEHLRAPIPLPLKGFKGDVIVSGTLVISPEVDPEHPAAYTRSGLEVAFRPHNLKYSKGMNGKKPQQPKTRTFFSGALLFGKSEALLREDGHKWEPCLRNSLSMRSSSLVKPCFDIFYHHRESGIKAKDPQPIPYAFVVSVKAPKVRDLYNRVVREYVSILQPLRPQTRIQVRA